MVAGYAIAAGLAVLAGWAVRAVRAERTGCKVVDRADNFAQTNTALVTGTETAVVLGPARESADWPVNLMSMSIPYSATL